MKLNNLRIGVRLSIAFAAILTLVAAMTAVGVWELGTIALAKNEMRAAAFKQQLAEQWLSGIASNAVRTYARVKTASAADEQFFESAMKNASERITTIQKEFEPLVVSAEGKRLLADVAARRKTYSEARDTAFALKKKDGADAAAISPLIEQQMVPAMNAYVASVEQVALYQRRVVDQADAAIDAVYARARALLVALGAAAMALGALMAYTLTRSITHPLGRAVVLAQTVAAGDLSADIDADARDEVGQLLASLKTMNTNLRATVSEVRVGTDTIATAAQEIAAGNLDLSVRTEQQASSLEETASSLEELTNTVKRNADHARQANHLADAASDVAQRGGAVVSEVVGTMASINESSRQIADIISVIDSIAFQTNILALNAAVEAARAGEQGRGFAVVASEVRTLAHRSAGAAKEIKALIDNSVAQVQAGGRLVDQAGTTMGEIVEAIGRVTGIMGDIADASSEQTLGIEQINEAVTQMDQVTQQNAAMVEEAAGAAASLEAQAAALARTVSVFVLDQPGTPARGRTAPPRRQVPRPQLA